MALLVLAGFVAQAASATGVPAGGNVTTDTWQAPTTLFSGSLADLASRVGGPNVALDARRRATAVWLYYSLSPPSGVIMESDWTATGGWTPARTLTPFGTDVSRPPALAVDARGDAVIAWIAKNQVRASYRPAGGAWRSPRTLSLPGELAGLPQVAIDDRGRALVAWNAARSSPNTTGEAFEIAARGGMRVWGKPKIICACLPVAALAMNASGLALVVWSPESGGLWAKTRSPTGRWSVRQEISSYGTGLAYMPLALNSQGAAVVGWVEDNPSTAAATLTISLRPAHGRFGRPQTIGGDPYWGFVLALAPTGEAVVIWENAGCCLFAIARRPGTSSFTSQQTLAPGFGRTIPGALAMDARGDTLALWARSDESNGHLYLHAAQRLAGGSFDGGSDIGDIGEDSYKHSACSGEPSLATTSNGRLVVAVWLKRVANPGSCTGVEAATFER